VTAEARQRVRPALLVAAAAALPYLQTLVFGFVFDDHGQIVGNPRVQSWSHLGGYFTGDVWRSPAGFPGNYYRPLFLLWLLVNHTLFDAWPAGWHLTSVGLHVLASLLVWLIARRLGGPAVGVIAGVLFAVHPIHVEAVAWISGATEPLLAVFLLAAFWCYLEGRRALSLLAYALALLSKETAVVLPLLVAVHAWATTPRDRARGALAAAAPYLLLAGIYALARQAALGGLGHARRPIPLGTMALTWPLLLFTYLKKLFWPVGLSAFDDTRYVQGVDLVHFALPCLALAAVAAALIVLARRSALAGVIALAALWMLIPILPVLNTSVFFRELVHDRYLYLPSVGFAILIAVLARGVPVAIAAVVACLLSSLAVRETIPWATDRRLYERGVAAAPGSAMARHGLAVEMDKLGRDDLAQALLEDNVARDPEYWLSVLALGILHYRHGRYDLADRELTRALSLNPDLASAHELLARIRMEQGRLDEAEAHMRRLIALQPAAPGLHYQLGRILRAKGSLEAALAEFREELRVDPSSKARGEMEATEAQARREKQKGVSVSPPPVVSLGRLTSS
jgi:tetratricopeptide (TPR) repeat protein